MRVRSSGSALIAFTVFTARTMSFDSFESGGKIGDSLTAWNLKPVQPAHHWQSGFAIVNKRSSAKRNSRQIPLIRSF
jgi:hypothetical protein